MVRPPKSTPTIFSEGGKIHGNYILIRGKTDSQIHGKPQPRGHGSDGEPRGHASVGEPRGHASDGEPRGGMGVSMRFGRMVWFLSHSMVGGKSFLKF